MLSNVTKTLPSMSQSCVDRDHFTNELISQILLFKIMLAP